MPITFDLLLVEIKANLKAIFFTVGPNFNYFYFVLFVLFLIFLFNFLAFVSLVIFFWNRAINFTQVLLTCE